MRRANWLSGIALRSALAVLVVFVIVLPVAGFAILRNAQAAFDSQIRSAITEDVNLFHDANIAGGEGELLNFIHGSLATRSDRQVAFGLFKRDGRVVAGNISALPHFRGWGVLDHGVGQNDGSRFLGFVETLGDNVIVVGHSLRAMEAISQTIFESLIVAGLVLCAAALAIGYWLNRTVSLKLAVIDRTLGAVSRGNAEIRVPVGTSNDQLDQVSMQINAHLDRLSELMATMRNTIVAIAHDLKSPLNRAFILVQEAADNASTPGDMARLSRASLEMETLRDVIDTVLRISRIESSDDSSRFAEFALGELVEDLAQTFEPVLHANGQTLSWTGISPDQGRVLGDRQMLTQMLVNLIENASRYAGANAHVQLGVGTSEDGGAILTVSDDGPGIAAQWRNDVLKPFHRLDPERNLPGAGLGLALVKAIALRHHGRLTLGDNAPGLKVEIVFPPPPAKLAEITAL